MGGFVGEESIICRLQSDLVVVHSNSPTRGVFGSDNYDEVDKVFEPFESAVSIGVSTRNWWDLPVTFRLVERIGLAKHYLTENNH